MATGRMLRAQISCSPQVNDLSLKAALLFTWMIPHVDDFGRMQANPRRIKAIVVPMRDDINLKEIHSALLEMEKQNLLVLYSVENELYISMRKFEQHQQGLHKRTQSKFPPPPCPEAALNKDSGKFREIPGNSHPTRTRTRTEQEQELINTSPSAPDSVQEIFSCWQKTMSQPKTKLDPARITKIKNALKLGYSVRQLKQAIEGCGRDDWHMGKNAQNKKYNSIGLIFRNADKIDGFLDMYDKIHGGVDETYCDYGTLHGGF